MARLAPVGHPQAASWRNRTGTNTFQSLAPAHGPVRGSRHAARNRVGPRRPDPIQAEDAMLLCNLACIFSMVAREDESLGYPERSVRAGMNRLTWPPTLV